MDRRSNILYNCARRTTRSRASRVRECRVIGGILALLLNIARMFINAPERGGETLRRVRVAAERRRGEGNKRMRLTMRLPSQVMPLRLRAASRGTLKELYKKKKKKKKTLKIGASRDLREVELGN
jgi:hypothetical protein